MLIFGWWDSLYGRAHVQPHLNTVAGVMRDGVWKTRHTVITVAQDFNTQTAIPLQREVREENELSTHTPEKHREEQRGRSVHLSDVVEAAEEFVEDGHELLRCAGARQVREAHDISVQGTAEPKYDLNKLHLLAVRGWASASCAH